MTPALAEVPVDAWSLLASLDLHERALSLQGFCWVCLSIPAIAIVFLFVKTWLAGLSSHGSWAHARERGGDLGLTRRAKLATCPYCKADILKRELEGVVRCTGCETVQHSACWNENGGCSIMGCKRSGGRERTTPATSAGERTSPVPTFFAAERGRARRPAPPDWRAS